MKAIDKTLTEIETALADGTNVVVKDGTLIYPYVGKTELNGVQYQAFGTSVVYGGVCALDGYLLGTDGIDDFAIQISQRTTIPTLNDVQIDGTSIVADGVAEIPIASRNALGVISILNSSNNMIATTGNGVIAVGAAGSSVIKAGNSSITAITPTKQHESTFYGLAKRAGDTTQSSSSNAVGTYTEDAKSKISEMLNGSVSVSGTTPTIVAKSGIRYVCGEVATLDLTPPATGICDVVFTSGATPTVLTVPSTVKWPDWFDPTALDANTTYEINVMDGLGVAVGWT